MAALAAAWSVPAVAAPPRPDILLITLDTTRADQLAVYGGPSATPALEAIARAGVRYEEAWSPAPLTLPAHASLFTGLHPAEHGLRDNGWGRLGAAMPVLAERLRAAGYRTAGFPASRVLDARFGLDRGFDLYDDAMAAERLGQFGYPERPAAEVVDAALAWLRAVPGDRPIFVWVHFYDPHAPYLPPEAPPGVSEPRRLYGLELEAVDRELGRLVAGWPAGRQRLVAAVGDHGEAFGEHGEVGHGLLLYRPTLQVPLLLAGPGVPTGKVVAGPVGIPRLGATLVKLAGLEPALPGPALPFEREHEPPAIFQETLFPASAYGWSPLAALTGADSRVIAAPRPEIYRLADRAEATNLLREADSGQRRAQRALAAWLERHPLEAEPPPVDPEVAVELRSLGYLSGQSGRAGTLDPKDGVALLGELAEAEAELQRGEPTAALKRLQALVGKSPQSVPFLSKLAEVQGQLGDHAGALATVDRALKASPRLDFLHVHRGETLLALGRRADAERAFRLALDLHPRAATAWLRLAEIALRDGRPADEEKLLQQGLAAGTTSAVISARLGEIALRRGDLEAADAHLRQATTLLPAWRKAWSLWAEVARRQNRPDLARDRDLRAR